MENLKKINGSLEKFAVSNIEKINKLNLTDAEEMELFLKLREFSRLTEDILARHSNDRA